MDYNPTVDEALLQKCQLGLSLLEFDNASDTEIVNGCLILKSEDYEGSTFKCRSDYSSVLAVKLKKVTPDMFFQADKLETVAMLEAEEILDGSEEVGAFSGTKLSGCFFPRLKRVGSYSFRDCQMKTLDEDNFPSLEAVEKHGFVNCPIERLSLPRLERVGDYGFSGCPATHINLPELVLVGKYGFENCSMS